MFLQVLLRLLAVELSVLVEGVQYRLRALDGLVDLCKLFGSDTRSFAGAGRQFAVFVRHLSVTVDQTLELPYALFEGSSQEEIFPPVLIAILRISVVLAQRDVDAGPDSRGNCFIPAQGAHEVISEGLQVHARDRGRLFG